jgi:hypothetical protein
MLQIPALWKMNVPHKQISLPVCIRFSCECLILVIILYFDFNTVSRNNQTGSGAHLTLLYNGNQGQSGLGMMLTAHFHLVLQSRVVELYPYTTLHLHDIVLSKLGSETALLTLSLS